MPPWLCGKGKPQPQAMEPRRGVRGLLSVLHPLGEQASDGLVCSQPQVTGSPEQKGREGCLQFQSLTSAWAHGAAGGRPDTKAGEKNGLLKGTSPAWNTWEEERYRYRCLSSLDLTVSQPSFLNLQALFSSLNLGIQGSSLLPQTQGSSL